jgi:hypothetical protein
MIAFWLTPRAARSRRMFLLGMSGSGPLCALLTDADRAG